MDRLVESANSSRGGPQAVGQQLASHGGKYEPISRVDYALHIMHSADYWMSETDLHGREPDKVVSGND